MARRGLWTLAATLAAHTAAYAQAHDPATRREHGAHTDVDAYIRMLDSESRDGYQKPDEVVAALALKPGDTVADIGAGSGYFTLRFARAVGAAGRVYAVDVEPRMVEHIEERAAEAGLANVTAALAPPDDPRLPEHKVDLVFFCDVWHHVEKQAAYIEALRNALAPGGRIVMIDYQKRPLPVGPGMDTKIAREDVVKQMQENGFRLALEPTFLPYQYFLVFTAAR
jgi:ubiquinone/menaquinone biosynthesis C-methylase UbiE